MLWAEIQRLERTDRLDFREVFKGPSEMDKDFKGEDFFQLSNLLKIEIEVLFQLKQFRLLFWIFLVVWSIIFHCKCIAA